MFGKGDMETGLILCVLALIAAIITAIVFAVRARDANQQLADQNNLIYTQQEWNKKLNKLKKERDYLEEVIQGQRNLRDNIDNQIKLSTKELSLVEGKQKAMLAEYADKIKEGENKLKEIALNIAAQEEQFKKGEIDYNKLQNTIELENGKLASIAEEIEQLKNHYREAVLRTQGPSKAVGQITITDDDRQDIDIVRRTSRGMNCENEILKALYTVYIKTQIEQVIKSQGVADVCGIYRIYYVDGDREISYVGQSVNVGERWKQHCKRMWGIDNVGRIELYERVRQIGIDKFYWELIEECDAAQLSEREIYWGNFYCVKENGLNKKLG